MAEGGKRLFAVADIGSDAVRMKIVQVSAKGVMEDLEDVEHPVTLGHEIFATGKLGRNGLQSLSEVLTKFNRLLQEYRVKSPRFIGTTALRVAANRNHILDYLAIHNGIQVEVLEEGEEKDYIYASLLRGLPRILPHPDKDALIAYIGTGNVGLSLLEKRKIILSLNLAFGSRRLLDILGEELADSISFPHILEEYIGHASRHLEKHFLGFTPQAFVAVSGELDVAAGILGIAPKNGVSMVSRGKLEQLCAELRELSDSQVAERYSISEEQAQTLYPALATCISLLGHTRADCLYIPRYSLCDFVLQEMFAGNRKRDKLLYEHTISTARRLAARYGCEKHHYKTVCTFSRLVFDNLKKRHGLSLRMRTVLEVAAILHEAGNYVTLRFSHADAFDLVKNSYIVGLSQKEIHLLACVLRFCGMEGSMEADNYYRYLPDADKLVVCKLAAIVRLADSLDRGGKSRVKKMKMQLKSDVLHISVTGLHASSLERWAFGLAAAAFADVFGVEAKLNIQYA